MTPFALTPLIAVLLQAAATQTPPTPPAAAPPYAMPGEKPVDAYTASNANAAATPFTGQAMAEAFHGQPGIHRIVDDLVARNYADPVIGDIFKGHDEVRLRRTLYEQFCYILNAGCDYTGRDMTSSHTDLGTQRGDMNKLVENLQAAMRTEKVPFAAQNRFLAKLAPMEPTIRNR